MTTIVKVLASERDIIAKSMAEIGMPVKFYTMENALGLVQCEVECTDPGLMFLFGKVCGHAVACAQIEKL
jgi:hypothetical protein